MKMFIANATRQVFDFTYRLPERPGAIRQVIPIGGQVQLAQDLLPNEVDYILEKNARYGLIPISEAERAGDFAGICYSVDRPISEDRLRSAMAKRVAVIEEIGREQRKNAAIAVHDQVERHLQEHRGLGNINGLDMSVEEQDGTGNRTLTGGISEKIKVHRASSDGETPKGRTGRRKAA